MSTDPISPNASEFFSPITFQFDNPEYFEVNCPLSPTSSVRGVYVRSRPTSMAVSELDVVETLTFPSNFASYDLSPYPTVPFLQAVPLARKKKAASIRSTRTTPLDATSHVIFDDSENVPPVLEGTGRLRCNSTWTRFRGSMSGIFHRKQPSLKSIPAPTEPELKLSTKFSLRSRVRADTVGKAAAPALGPIINIAPPTTTGVDESESPMERKNRVRRSRSFSGFTTAVPSSHNHTHNQFSSIADGYEYDSWDGLPPGDWTKEEQAKLRALSAHYWGWGEDDGQSCAAAI
ncbi:hypothetical protein FB45DRAFT_1086699 [Roridomyces roridus]|uniref:Uncharacterized protein n=1 Tax=Roridomyces roridus TaxID=1738132 RepID=A0AAD7FKC2_9AGAR|nr:hypothetical protein FB45DRAFT_1086699 [Roridomyces roridus]